MRRLESSLSSAYSSSGMYGNWYLPSATRPAITLGSFLSFFDGSLSSNSFDLWTAAGFTCTRIIPLSLQYVAKASQYMEVGSIPTIIFSRPFAFMIFTAQSLNVLNPSAVLWKCNGFFDNSCFLHVNARAYSSYDPISTPITKVFSSTSSIFSFCLLQFFIGTSVLLFQLTGQDQQIQFYDRYFFYFILPFHFCIYMLQEAQLYR